MLISPQKIRISSQTRLRERQLIQHQDRRQTKLHCTSRSYIEGTEIRLLVALLSGLFGSTTHIMDTKLMIGTEQRTHHLTISSCPFELHCKSVPVGVTVCVHSAITHCSMLHRVLRGDKYEECVRCRYIVSSK